MNDTNRSVNEVRISSVGHAEVICRGSFVGGFDILKLLEVHELGFLTFNVRALFGCISSAQSVQKCWKKVHFIKSLSNSYYLMALQEAHGFSYFGTPETFPDASYLWFVVLFPLFVNPIFARFGLPKLSSKIWFLLFCTLLCMDKF